MRLSEASKKRITEQAFPQLKKQDGKEKGLFELRYTLIH